MLLKQDTSRFYNCIEQALKNHNPTEGVSSDGYAADARWERFWGEKRFLDLLKKYKR